MAAISVLELDEDDDLNDSTVAKIHKYQGFSFGPAQWDIENEEGTLLTYSLLKLTDSTTYTGHEFEYRNAPMMTWVDVFLGGETFSIEVTLYGYKYMTDLWEGESPPFDHDQGMLHYVSYSVQFPTSQMKYGDVPLTSPTDSQFFNASMYTWKTVMGGNIFSFKHLNQQSTGLKHVHWLRTIQKHGPFLSTKTSFVGSDASLIF